MANEFKIKNGLILGVPSTSQPVTSIKDTSISITSDASSILVTGKAIYDFHQANVIDPEWGSITGSISSQTDLSTWLTDLSTYQRDVSSYINGRIDDIDIILDSQDASIGVLEAYQLIQDGSIDANWQRWLDSNRTGFLNQTDTSLSFNDSTYVFTLGDEGAGWSYYRDGVKWDITGDVSIRLTASGTPPADTYYITIDSTNGSLSVSTTPWSLDGTELLVAYVDFDSSNTPTYVIGEERHSMLIDRRIHKYLHETRGTQFVSGGILTGPDVLAGDTTVIDSSNAVGISATEIADEDLFQILPELTRPDGATTSYFTFLRSGGNLSDWAVENLPFPEAGGNIQYDNGTSMSEATSGKYVNSYIMFTNLTGDSGNPRFAILPGQNEYDDLDTAIDENPAAFNFSGMPIAEYVIAWQLTWECSTGYSTTGNVALASSPKRIQVNATTASSITTEAHNDLLGLQGGNASERYHLSLTQFNDYVGKTYVDGSLNAKQDDISFGSQYQIPTSNSGGDDFTYFSGFGYNGRSIVAADSSFNLYLTGTFWGTGANPYGFGNTAIGDLAGQGLQDGGSNTYLGFAAGVNLTQGGSNTFLGSQTGGNLNSGNDNLLIGIGAGNDIIDASNNVFIGANAGYNETGSFKLYIDSAPTASHDASSALIYGEFNGTRKLRVNAQDIEFNGIQESTESKLIYFDTTSNRISYGNAPADISTFIGLNDTPNSYDPVDASPGMAVVINDAGDGLEFGPRIWREESNEVTLANENADVLFYENIEIEPDSGIGTFVDKSVTASSAADTEESYTFNMDGITIAKIYAESDGAGSIKNEKFVSSVTFQAESSVYFTGIPEASTSYVLFYNPTSNEVTYAEASTAGGGGSVSEWGDIDGDITNQTDLWTILNDLSTNKIGNSGSQILDGSLNITGNLVVDGSATIINTTNLDVSDNIIYINTGMSGTPPSTMVSGMKIDRGSEDPYFFIFAEDTDTFRVGTEADEPGLPGNTQAVATREDDPISEGIAYWNNSLNRFDTSTTLQFESGDLFVQNDVSIQTDIRIGNDIYAPNLQEVSTGQVVFYNTITGLFTYADASITGGGGDSYWTLDGSILRPSDETVNVELSAIQVNTDAGATTLVDMDVSSATSGSEQSYAFNIDGSTVAKVYGKAASSGDVLEETGFVVETVQYMGHPETNGSWRFYPDSNGDLVFEKRIGGSWVAKGKFTE